MAEYIEREAAVMKIADKRLNFDTECDAEYAETLLFGVPTADVVEVRHGEWVPYEQPLGAGYSIPNYKPTHCCSHCKGFGWEFYAICPHCGAKMDGKGEGE